MACFNILNPAKVLFFADGSSDRGYGHLFRVKNLAEILEIKSQSIFVYENDYQANFYNSFGITAININSLGHLEEQLDYCFIDSKIEIPTSILKVKSKERILIDSHKNNHDSINIVITPSFYSNSDKHILDRQTHLSGENYAILDPRIYTLDPNNRSNQKLVLSFGGSDPNNISLKFLKAISDSQYLKDIILILGPGYPHSREELLEFISEEQLILNPENIFDIFMQAYLVVTALGVTIQELTYLNINTGVIYNYKEDILDIQKIEAYYNRLSTCNKFFDFGHHATFNLDLILDQLEIAKESNMVNDFSSNFGLAWREAKNY